MSNYPEVSCWVRNAFQALGLSPAMPIVPNFNAIRVNERTPRALADLAGLIKSHPVICGRVLFHGRPKGYVRATRAIGVYATNLGAAIECRLKGEVDWAELYERSANQIHSKLPKFARW